MNFRHPWNIGTLFVGIGLLIAGSSYFKALDWDISISLIMAGFPISLQFGHLMF